MKIRHLFVTTALVALSQTPARAQHLHVHDRWSECSFRLSSSLTPAAWRQFTQEAGLVVYFRSLTDAKPMGKGRYEVSALQWKTGIDDADAAWNDTFVHPDSAHYLFEGSGLSFPGLMVRAGLTGTTDIGVYVTKNPNANYGFYGAQLQRTLLGANSDWTTSARTSFVSLYGPEDLDYTVYGADLVTSRAVRVSRWLTVSPYVGGSVYHGRSHEKSAVVNLEDESATGVQGMLGTTLQVSKARIGAEYNFAKVNSVSFKVGVGF
jgi:hypothetical protein